jgi:hypothetical protein
VDEAHGGPGRQADRQIGAQIDTSADRWLGRRLLHRGVASRAAGEGLQRLKLRVDVCLAVSRARTATLDLASGRARRGLLGVVLLVQVSQ